MPKTSNPLLLRRKSSSSPFSSAPRRKSSSTTAISKSSSFDDVPLPSTNLRPSLAPSGIHQNVLSLLEHTASEMWSEIPEPAGMNSERIAEILRFRARLPPIVSLAQLHAYSLSGTQTDRELASLVAKGVVRKVSVATGRGGSGGEGAAVVAEWKRRVRDESEDVLSSEMKERYLALLCSHPASPTAPMTGLSAEQVRVLVQTGFLTLPTASSSSLFAPLPPESSAIGLAGAGYKAATGTLAAVGGRGAVHESGGGGSTLATQTTRAPTTTSTRPMTFALPATGAYWKLVSAALTQLLNLLKQLSPRHKEATFDQLKEKWEGNVLDDAASRAKRARGEWTGVLPGRTRKWREFYGLRFEYVLAEAVGRGSVELFDTGTVGLGIRAT